MPWVQSLIGELRSCPLSSEAKKKKKKKKVIYKLQFLELVEVWRRFSLSDSENLTLISICLSSWLSSFPHPSLSCLSIDPVFGHAAAVWSLSCVRLFVIPKDRSLPGSPVHEILQARILEWVSIPFSREFSWSRNGIRVSCTAARFFTTEPLGEAPIWAYIIYIYIYICICCC